MSLTETEKRIIEFLEKHPGASAKEVAERLGVSVKTVYKAKWKAGASGKRRAPEDLAAEIAEAVADILEERLSSMLQLLAEAVAERVKAEVVREISALLEARPQPAPARAAAPPESDLPDFVRDNPWLEVLSSRGARART